jgi:hypothetical protein
VDTTRRWHLPDLRRSGGLGGSATDTYWVGAEAPAGDADVPEDPIGGRSRLRQTQSFIRRTPDASWSFTVSAAFIETTDLNAALGRTCPPAHSDGLFCDLVKGELFLDVQAFTVPPAPVSSSSPMAGSCSSARPTPRRGPHRRAASPSCP